ncbi:30S ribosomal protein S8 [Candidatus Peregrinibacteria bacterium]|jgi:small subunit ribosomal protein S8|nr:30S ribosomal protein S8 [Candidatus Peregrinibacteria bacterium]MBT7484436.1 30S ribosomal protein S8 [Candidatus Peregrinibacteria bacterium]MBT7703701.1 30S ribosomal protein S8 [Candidatus Peregrinibacteria bacterium]
MNTDPIADMLTRLRNADAAGHKEVRMPYSKMKHNMLQVMVKNEYLDEVNIDTSGKFQEIHVVLKKRPHPLNIKRVSKPGQRIYVKAKEVPTVLNGLGMAILSTPQGIISNKTAKRSKVGGELLCEIY